MSKFELYIRNNKISRLNPNDSEIYDFGDCKITLFGFFFGIIIDDKTLKKEDALREIAKNFQKNEKEHLNKLISNAVGPSYFIICCEDRMSIYASPSSYGFFFSLTDNDGLYVNNLEGEFYKKISEMNKNIDFDQMLLLNSVVSHHSVIRAPFKGILKNTMRCPPGCVIEINNEEVETDCYLMLNEKNLSEKYISKNDLQNTFIRVADLIVNSLIEKDSSFKIAFSGGIDSSLLLSLFYNKIDHKNSIYYKDYGTEDEKQLAENIARSFKKPLELLGGKHEINYQFLRSKCASGLGTIVNEEQLKTGATASPFTDNSKDNFKFNITGQNADTLFHIDHFGPDNREMGFVRMIYILYFLHKRVYYSMPYYNQKWWLRFYPFSVPNKNYNRSIYDLLKSTFSGVDEHVGPFEEEYIKTPECISREEFQEFRKKIFFDPLSELCEKKYVIDINKESINKINPYIVNHIVRLSRWFRSINNFSTQFGNLSIFEQYNILMFFSEGPISSNLLNYRLHFKDNFYIKNFIIDLFNKNSNYTYSKQRFKAFHNSNYINFFIANLARLFLILRNQIKKRFFYSIQKKDETLNKNFHLSEVLSNLIESDEKMILVNIVKDERIKQFFNDCYNKITKKNLDNLDRKSKMELCRFTNLHLMVKQMNLKSFDVIKK